MSKMQTETFREKKGGEGRVLDTVWKRSYKRSIHIATFRIGLVMAKGAKR